MGRGDDRNGFYRRINAKLEAGGVDVWETFFEEFLGFVTDIKENAAAAGAFHFLVNGAGDNVTWSKIFTFVIALHKGLIFLV